VKALAPQPNRSTNSITLSWGPLNIPCSVYTGTESVAVQRREFVKDTDHAVGRVCIDKVDGTVIDRADIVKRSEATDGSWVELDDDEIAAVTTERGLATIETFIPTTKVGEYLTEGLSQVRAKRVKGKTDPGGNRSLGLLLAALKAEKVVALVKVALRGPARYALLDKDGYLRFVVTADCIRQPLDVPVAVAGNELALARQLITLVGKSTPDLTDDTAATIQAYVDSKAAGQPVVTLEEHEAAPQDLTEQLLAAIAARKEAGAA